MTSSFPTHHHVESECLRKVQLFQLKQWIMDLVCLKYRSTITCTLYTYIYIYNFLAAIQSSPACFFTLTVWLCAVAAAPQQLAKMQGFSRHAIDNLVYKHLQATLGED